MAVWLRSPRDEAVRCPAMERPRPPEVHLLAVFRIHDGVAQSPLAPDVPVPSGTLAELEAEVRRRLPSDASSSCVTLELVRDEPRLREIVGLLLEPQAEWRTEAPPARRPVAPAPFPAIEPVELKPGKPKPGDYWRRNERERLSLPGSG